MEKRSRLAVAGAIGFLTLVIGVSASSADSLDAGLVGAWTASQADCAKLFVRRGRMLAYRLPIDRFAQAAIIEPQSIRAPASTCRVHSVSHANDAIKISAECNDSISYTTENVQITVKSGSEIVYSPTGDHALDTTLVKCPL